MMSHVVYAHVHLAINAIQMTDNSELLFHGVYHIQATDITTGLVYMVESSGMDSLVLL